jgi:hypothetical protein
MDSSLLKEMSARCRSLADNADQFTKKRLLDLAAKYDRMSGEPSRASFILKMPVNLPDRTSEPEKGE